MQANFMVAEVERYPVTRAEYEALRKAGTGTAEVDGKGSNYTDLLKGMNARYEFAPRKYAPADWNAAKTLFEPNDSVGVQGLYPKLPARLRVTGFQGAHSAFLIVLTATTGLWLDPLKPKGSLPVKVQLDELAAYFNGFNGEITVASQGEAFWRDDVIRLSFERWSVPAGTKVYEHPSLTAAVVTSYSSARQVTTVGLPMDSRASISGDDRLLNDWRVVMVTTGAIDGKTLPKLGYIKKPATLVATDPAWDIALLTALNDITFRGEVIKTVDATETQKTEAYNQGVASAAAEALTAKRV
jgi:hypothetical protein